MVGRLFRVQLTNVSGPTNFLRGKSGLIFFFFFLGIFGLGGGRARGTFTGRALGALSAPTLTVVLPFLFPVRSRLNVNLPVTVSTT